MLIALAASIGSTLTVVSGRPAFIGEYPCCQLQCPINLKRLPEICNVPADALCDCAFGERAHHNDGDASQVGINGHRLQHTEPIEHWHHEIQEHQVRPLLLDKAQPLAPIHGKYDVMTFIGEEVAQQFADAELIVHDEKLGHLLLPWPARALCRSSSGNAANLRRLGQNSFGTFGTIVDHDAMVCDLE